MKQTRVKKQKRILERRKERISIGFNALPTRLQIQGEKLYRTGARLAVIFLIIIAPHRLRPAVEFLEQASVRPFYRCINFNSLANRQRLFHIELNPQMFGYSTQ